MVMRTEEADREVEGGEPLTKLTLSQDQVRAMASSVRQRIVAVLFSQGQSSISEIAEALERRPDSLYHHVRVLLGVGLIRQTGERVAGRNHEALYETVAGQFAADLETQDPQYMAEFSRMMRSVLADGASHHAQAFTQPETRARVLFETANVRLGEEQVEQFNRELRDLVHRVKGAAEPDAGRHLFVFLSTPIGKT